MHSFIILLITAIFGLFTRNADRSIKFKKVVRDLLINPGRTALAVFALVIGLWGVGSLLVSTTILQNDLKANFLNTSPSHAILTSKDFAKLNLAALRNRPEVESAEFRDLSMQRIEVNPDEWIPLWLFGVEDFSRVHLARFYSENGEVIPPTGTMLMERDGQKISNLKPGVRARIRVGGRILNVPVSGINFDPAQAPATQDHFIYGYADKKTFSDITGEPSNQRLILRFKNVNSRGEVQALVNSLTGDLQKQAIAVETFNIPKLNEHPHQWQLNTLLGLQGSIGLLAFLMAGVLVSQLMASILSRQIRQIGILKAIGASGFQVVQMYLTMVLLMGMIASMIAIPLAVLSGNAFARFVADILNFQILTTELPVYLYGILISFGLLVPILFSLPALVKGVRVSVYDAISDYGIPREGTGNKTDKVSFISLPTLLVMAIRNTRRRKYRLLLTVVTMAFGVAVFSTGFNVRQSLWMLLSDVKDGMKHDVQVVLGSPLPKDHALAPFQTIKNISRIEAWNGGKGELQNKVVSTNDGVGVVALPYDTDLFNLKMEKGRWLKGGKAPEVVMNQQAVELYKNPKVGETHLMKVAGKELTVRLVGIVMEFEKPKIYMDRELYDAFANPGHLVNSLMFVADNKGYDQIMDLKKDIEKAIAKTDLNVLYVMSQAERVQVVYDHLNIILTTIVFLALTVLMVSALGMASATGINIMERTREIGVLRAIGATPEKIYKLFVTEGMIISAASVGLGLLLALPLSLAATPFFGNLMLGDNASLRFAFSIDGFWITLVTTLLFGWLASRIPARKAIQVSTREALSYE